MENNWSVTGARGEGELPYETDGDARRLAYGCKFRMFGLLRVFWENPNIFSRKGLLKG